MKISFEMESGIVVDIDIHDKEGRYRDELQSKIEVFLNAVLDLG